MSYENLLVGLAIDLAAISLLSYAIYFRRHQRRDLTLGFIGVNVGLFAVASFISNGHLGVGFGIGLFALLSVIRLRSTQVTQEEIGYYFVALVLGLVNGVSPEESWGRTAILNVLLLGVMFVADHPRVLPHIERRIVILDDVHRHDDALKVDLERKLGHQVTRMRVLDVDYVHGRTRVDARYRTDRPGAPPKPKKPEPEPEPADPEPYPYAIEITDTQPPAAQ
jgi:Domain of unknown function (DUF4956)